MVLASPATAAADTISTPGSQDALPARRYEFLPVPDVGGNSDVGVEFGVVFTLARFYDEARPYKWLFGGTLGTSFKDDADGLRLVQHYHAFRLDVPNLFDGRVRIDTRAHFLRNIIARWEGVGNASTAEDAPGADPLRKDEYIAQEVRLRSVARVKTGTPFEAAFTTSLRYVFPSVYQDSKLAHDIARSDLPGTEKAFLGSLGAGLFLDTRDDEFVPHEGVFYQVGFLGTAGTAERVGFGEASAALHTYIPLGPKMTFAMRHVASFLFGRVPFYELQSGGVFNPTHMVGGERGVRGIPEARYAGHIKVMANYELRTSFIPSFRVLSWQLQIGTTTFLDAGRVWNDWGSSVADGSTPGIKYSVGGGFYFQWDRSSVFRVEIAHSPTDHAPDEFPLAYYLANGLIF
ncbi:outer membrane protein assembly factor [Pendulispora brunnea]|uniref:Outer membrane protein assembly factor n=1 Tax=Pendulispora brunnea TaxID=2905690 RepID=A0ABZ2KIS9_9BACT